MNLSSYRDRSHWSFSSLNQILNFCSLQWMFEKIERLQRPFTPIGIAMGVSRVARGVFDPPVEFYRPLPPLAYLPLIESGFRTNAKSPASAVGPSASEITRSSPVSFRAT